MQKSSFDFQPDLVTYEGETVLVCFEPEQVTETIEEVERKYWMAYAVRVHQPLNRSNIIDAIVTAAYPNDVMQAIVNNHLLDPTDEDHEAEFNEMQQWRAKAKAVAADVLEHTQS